MDDDINVISNIVIMVIRIMLPSRPKHDVNMVNIKSVPASGRYIGALLKPCPRSFDVDIDIIEFSNCIPFLLFQFMILSIL